MYTASLDHHPKPAKDWFSGALPHSLASSPWVEQVCDVLNAALQAVDPTQAVLNHIQRVGQNLRVRDITYDLRDFQHIYVVGAGKAGVPMAEAVAQLLGDQITLGTVLVKEGYGCANGHLPNRISVLEAGHPVPDQRGLAGSKQIYHLLEQAGSNDLILSLISGGCSALMTYPSGDIPLESVQSLTQQLLNSGTSISEINTIRKHIEILKGGQLARAAHPARVISLILSDVVGNPLEVIASGPTVADPTTYPEALMILRRYNLFEGVPEPILTHLTQGADGVLPETPKPGDPLFERVQNVIIGSNWLACQAALDKARELGFHTLILTTYLQGEARQAGRFIATLAREINSSQSPVPRPACLISGGETTVTVHGQGLGGRNLELALGAVNDLAGLTDIALLTLASDGGDGPTDAAGAIVTGETLERAKVAGLEVEDYLNRNDSYHFFDSLDDLLKPGPTLTNVNDLTFLFAF
jgi:hydroxypyruvate reductase